MRACRFLPFLLFALVLLLAGGDFLVAMAGHYALDGRAYSAVMLLSSALFAGGIFYTRWRVDPRLAAMLLGTSFLCAFSAAAALLNYLLLPVAGPRIDSLLAAMDRALGFNWPAVMGWAAAHPLLNRVLFIAYASMLPQVALLILALARVHRIEQLYRFCLSLALAALLAITVWSLAPSFGAFSVYHLAPAIARKLTLALDQDYARQLLMLLKNGPGFIAPSQIRGLIGFPSYHAALALLVVWHARCIKTLRWPALAWNILVLIATPIQGGHHLVDVLGAFPLAAMALALTALLCSIDFAKLVNKRRILTLAVVPKASLRAAAAHNAAPARGVIKSVLNRSP